MWHGILRYFETSLRPVTCRLFSAGSKVAALLCLFPQVMSPTLWPFSHGIEEIGKCASWWVWRRWRKWTTAKANTRWWWQWQSLLERESFGWAWAEDGQTCAPTRDGEHAWPVELWGRALRGCGDFAARWRSTTCTRWWGFEGASTRRSEGVTTSS